MLHRLFHITLAALLLISSSGLVLSQHFCRGELKSSALFIEAASCHAQPTRKHCPHHPPAEQTAKPIKGCCDTTVDFLQLDSEQLAADSSLPVFQTAIALCIPGMQLGNISPIDSDYQQPHYLHYKPPLLVRDFPVSLQTFLC